MHTTRLLNCWIIATLGFCLLGAGTQTGLTHAQTPLTRSAEDLPTQRWIPIPAGQQSDMAAQAQILQQFRNFVVSKSDAAPLPELSEAQLQQMEDVFLDWQKQSGETKLPNLDSIPKEWINDVLRDPIARMQAQRLLEQYANSRGRPPHSPPTLPGQNAIPLANDNPLSETRPQGDLPAPSKGDSRDAVQGTSQQPTRPGATANDPKASTPQPSDAQRIEALRDLFIKLQGTQAPTPGAEPVSENPRTSVAKTPHVPNVPSDSRQQSKTSAPRNTYPSPRTTQNLYPRTTTSDARTGNSLRDLATSTSPATDPTAPGANLGAASTQSNSDGFPTNDIQSPSPFSDPFSPDFNSLPQQAFAEGRAFTNQKTETNSRASGNRQSPDARRSDQSISGKDSVGMTSPSQPKPNVDLDIKTQVEQQGLGATLRRIVEKTIQNETAKQDSGGLSKTEPAPMNWWTRKQSSDAPAKTAENPRSKESIPQWTKDTARSAINQAQSALSSDGGTKDNRFRNAMASIWKAISSVPNDANSGTLSSSPSVNLASGASQLGLRWNFGGWPTLLLCVLLAGLILILARRRLQLVQNSRAVEARWVKEILEVGIRTRGDVVRAFHYFVLRRPQAVHLWWTHRYAAHRLCETSPNLRTAIQDLTSVYEQARYLPPEVDLSSEQFQRAQAALQQVQAV